VVPANAGTHTHSTGKIALAFLHTQNGSSRSRGRRFHVNKFIPDSSALRGNGVFPAAVSVRYDRRIGRVVISFESGLEIAFPPRAVEGLENVRPADLAGAEISPSGLGVHFPVIDAAVYIPAILEGFLGSKRWLASQMGKAGGRTSSDSKAAAARGKFGGRPRKVQEALE
ncbi:MAG: DUF2442 domain-containing protein, partial [Telluria sp.]